MPLDIGLVRGLERLLTLHGLGCEDSIERGHFPATCSIERIDASHALVGELGPNPVRPLDFANHEGLATATSRHTSAHPDGPNGAQVVDAAEGRDVARDNLTDALGLRGRDRAQHSHSREDHHEPKSHIPSCSCQLGFLAGKVVGPTG
jgi:hypothetical protein